MKVLAVFVLLCLVAASFAQSQVDFTLRMTGSCIDSGTGDFKTFCTAKGNSQSVQTVIDTTDAVEETVNTKIGSYAVIEMNLTSLVENTFIGFGNMTFGTHLRREHTLNFESLGVGFNVPTNDTFVYSFGATFNAFGADGVFERSYGTLTMNGYINFLTTVWTVYVNGIVYNADD